MKLKVNCGRFHCSKGSFHPGGTLRSHGARHNPAEQIKGKTISARLFVGLSVKNKPKWTPKNVIDIVSAVRTKQIHDPSASFLSQTGVYQHQDGKHVVKERSVQVIVIDTHGTPQKAFENQMTAMAETIARRLKQESVIVDVQVNGVSRSVWWVTP